MWNTYSGKGVKNKKRLKKKQLVVNGTRVTNDPQVSSVGI